MFSVRLYIRILLQVSAIVLVASLSVAGIVTGRAVILGLVGLFITAWLIGLLVYYLNASNRVIDRMRVSQGGVSATVVDHRLIVKRAVEKLANALVLVHNHPSGNELPSDEDKALTGRVDLAASLFDITLLDHVIVTAGPCYSFRSHGFFDKRPNP